MAFVNWIKQLIVDLKIYLKVNLIYPKQDKFKNVKSILPADIQLGEAVVIEEKVVFGSALKKIGNGVFIGNNTSFSYCTAIGNYSSISTGVKIGLVAHPLDYISTSPVFYSKRRGWLNQDIYDEKQKGYTEIGNDVLISANALILAGVKIGHGAVIAAGAFVNKDVPPYAIVAGMPAKVIRYRFEQNLINQLLKSEWWLLPPSKLKTIVHYSDNPEVFLNKLKDL